MRPADARRSASISIRSSIRWSLTSRARRLDDEDVVARGRGPRRGRRSRRRGTSRPSPACAECRGRGRCVRQRDARRCRRRSGGCRSITGVSFRVFFEGGFACFGGGFDGFAAGVFAGARARSRPSRPALLRAGGRRGPRLRRQAAPRAGAGEQRAGHADDRRAPGARRGAAVTTAPAPVRRPRPDRHGRDEHGARADVGRGPDRRAVLVACRRSWR